MISDRPDTACDPEHTAEGRSTTPANASHDRGWIAGSISLDRVL